MGLLTGSGKGQSAARTHDSLASFWGPIPLQKARVASA
jgi:hypothetical protein